MSLNYSTLTQIFYTWEFNTQHMVFCITHRCELHTQKMRDVCLCSSLLCYVICEWMENSRGWKRRCSQLTHQQPFSRSGCELLTKKSEHTHCYSTQLIWDQLSTIEDVQAMIPSNKVMWNVKVKLVMLGHDLIAKKDRPSYILPATLVY